MAMASSAAVTTALTFLFLIGTSTLLRAVDAEEVGKPDDVNQDEDQTTQVPEPEISISTLFESFATLDKRVKVQEDFLGHIAAAARGLNFNSESTTHGNTPTFDDGLPSTSNSSVSLGTGTSISRKLNSSLDFQRLLEKVGQLESIVERGRRLNTFLGPDLKLTNSSGGCHIGNAVGNPLIITSPGWPGTYPKRKLCKWTVEGPSDYAIHVNITRMGINQCSGCTCDHLEFSDMKPDNSTTLLGRYCGSRTGSFYTRSNRLGIVFESLYSGLYNDGFVARLSL